MPFDSQILHVGLQAKLNIVAKIKIRRHEWIGHLVRMSVDRTIKKFLGKPDGRSKTGRPKLNWLGCTESDLKSMGVIRRKQKISVWAVILRRHRLNCKDLMPMKKKKKKAYKLPSYVPILARVPGLSDVLI